MTPRGVAERAGQITRPGRTRRPGGLALTALILIIVYLAVRLTGGAPNPLVHFAYLAIIVAGVTLGPLGGALSGLAAGLLLGPLMPDHTATSATILGHWGWLVRLGAYVAAGLLVAAVVRHAGRAAGTEAARHQARAILNLAASEPTSLTACRRLLLELARRRSTLAATIYVLEPGSAYLLAGWAAPGIHLDLGEQQTGADVEQLRQQASGVPRRCPLDPAELPRGVRDAILSRGGRSELVIPLVLDGEPLGILFAVDSEPPRSFDESAFQGLMELANGAAALVRRAQQDENAATRRAVDLVTAVLERSDLLTHVFQPILSVSGRGVAGYEALARFAVSPEEPPTVWFARATMAGLGAELQALAITRARAAAAAARMPAGSFLAVNVSPGLLAADVVAKALAGDLHGVVIEITEEEAVADADYHSLRAAMAGYRARGAQFSIDDAGAGYASMRHVTELRPDFVKLDARLITGLRDDTGRQALVRAMQAFTAEIGAMLIAEGVETIDELALLAATGLPLLAQGYAVARPGAPWPAVSRAALDLLQRPRPVPTAGSRRGVVTLPSVRS